MRVTFFLLFFLLFGLLPSYTQGLRPAKRSIESIMNELTAKYQNSYTKYAGVKGRYNLEIREMDPQDSNKLLSLAHAKVIRRDYFYKKAELQVLEFEKNGNQLPPSEYAPPSFEPIFPFFDAEASKRYRFTLKGIGILDGKELYEIYVQPKKKGARYFRGFLYVGVKEMTPLFIKGTIAVRYFFLKEFLIKLEQKDVKDVSAMLNSVVQTRVYVPMVIKDRRYITIMKGSSLELIPK